MDIMSRIPAGRERTDVPNKRAGVPVPVVWSAFIVCQIYVFSFYNPLST